MQRTKLGEESEAPRLSRFVETGHVPANRNLVETTPSLGLSDSLSEKTDTISSSIPPPLNLPQLVGSSSSVIF